MAKGNAQRKRNEFKVSIEGITLPDESVHNINESVQKAALAAMAAIDLRGKELIFSPIMARILSDPEEGEGEGEGSGSRSGGGAQINVGPLEPNEPFIDALTPQTTSKMTTFHTKLASSKAAGAQAIRISRVKRDLHLEQLGSTGKTIVGFVMHPITNKAKKVTAVVITRMGSNGGRHSSLTHSDRAALAIITDELSQFKASGGPTGASGRSVMRLSLRGALEAIDAGIACGLAGVEFGLNPLADAGCSVATGLMLGDDDDDGGDDGDGDDDGEGDGPA